MECPKCGYIFQQSSTPDTDAVSLTPPDTDAVALTPPDTDAASLRTHDTSATSYHIPLPDWLEQLDQAVQSAFPKRFAGYTKVAVLMICWEETFSDAARREYLRLASVFRDIYKYSVTEWLIPSEKPDFAISVKMNEFIGEYDNRENLVIVYYAGHAQRNTAGGSFPIWQPQKKFVKGKQIDTAIFHPLLVRAEDDSPDVVLLYDCCFSLASHRTNSNSSKAEVEGLFAGGFESQVPIAGPDSFTKHLTDALAIASKSERALTVAELHREIILRLQSFHEQAIFDANQKILQDEKTGKVCYTKSIRVTPSHLFLAGNEKPRLIALRPLGQKPSPSENSNVLPGEPETHGWPRVLLSIKLLDDTNIEEELKDWILRAPPGVVEFRGIFPSFSCLLLIEVPVVVWDLLPPCPAVSFVSFISYHIQEKPVDLLDISKLSAHGATALTAGHQSAQNSQSSTNWSGDTKAVWLEDSDDRRSRSPSRSPQARPARIYEPWTLDHAPRAAQESGQRQLLSLLDRADACIHQILQNWRAAGSHQSLSREQWLLREFENLGGSSASNFSYARVPSEHREFMSRYLSMHEFLTHDSTTINIASRLDFVRNRNSHPIDFNY
ncbi:hypothetical protein F4777DRAFT_494788 [Nemania sp. FL0916]|nr:hypothetical protein F4777DRAFT_494788 [Nemania sp. FL0916]